MEKITYTNDELKALALDALKGDAKTEALYAYNDGTFLNEDQYKKQLKDAVDKNDTALESETKALFRIANPNVKKSETDKEKDKQIKELIDEVGRLGDVAEENGKQISSLRSQLSEAKGALSDATARLANADETFAAMKSEADEAKAKIAELTASNKELTKQLKAAATKTQTRKANEG